MSRTDLSTEVQPIELRQLHQVLQVLLPLSWVSLPFSSPFFLPWPPSSHLSWPLHLLCLYICNIIKISASCRLNSGITLKFGEFLGIDLSFLLADFEVSNDTLELGLVDARHEPAVDILIRLPVLSITNVLIQMKQSAGYSDISEGNPLADQESMRQKMIVESCKGFLQFLSSLVRSLGTNK